MRRGVDTTVAGAAGARARRSVRLITGGLISVKPGAAKGAHAGGVRNLYAEARYAVAKQTLEVAALARRLEDKRSKAVVFLSHCLLNENVRHLGGACRMGCVLEIVEPCIQLGIGMVQLPCPEEQVWGGVPRRRLLRLYGIERRLPLVRPFLGSAVSLALEYSRVAFRRLARRAAAQIQDYVDAGYTVVGIVGVDGSPSCGVTRIVGARFATAAAKLRDDELTPERLNALILKFAAGGRGLFIDELQKELRRRRLSVPLLAHDLLRELAGQCAPVDFQAATAGLPPWKTRGELPRWKQGEPRASSAPVQREALSEPAASLET